MQGRITSYIHPEYSRYSSFLLDGIPQQILYQKDRVLALTQSSISAHAKGGMLQFRYRDALFGEINMKTIYS